MQADELAKLAAAHVGERPAVEALGLLDRGCGRRRVVVVVGDRVVHRHGLTRELFFVVVKTVLHIFFKIK